MHVRQKDVCHQNYKHFDSFHLPLMDAMKNDNNKSISIFPVGILQNVMYRTNS